MLENYKKSQPIVYRILKNAVSKDKYSHAYLIETNGFCGSYDLALSFAKAILCPKHYLDNKNCQNCHQCQVIDSGNFPEIEIIKPEGMWIKKSQVKNLQNEFNKKSIMGKNKVYIITESEKLKIEAANSILKFLEEPEKGIVAILLTENIYQVLETIKSRCQIISLRNQNNKNNNEKTLEKLTDLFIEEKSEELENKISKIIEFIIKYEKLKMSMLLYTQKLWHDYITTKEDYESAFNIIILFYKDILNKKIDRKLEYFNDYENELNEISQKNTTEEICYKLKVLTEFKEKLKYNANASLFMDKLIIELEGESND